MRAQFVFGSALFALSALVACGGEEPPPHTPTAVAAPVARVVPHAPAPFATTPDAPFRQKAPEAGERIAFTPPVLAPSFKTKNGLAVYVIERHDLPIVTARFVGAGAADIGGPPGAATFMGALLEMGTKTRTALQISDDYEALGAQHGAWLDWDSSGGYVKVPTAGFEPAMGILADVLKNADFKADEVARFRDRRKNGLRLEKNSPGSMLSNTLYATLFGRAHVYGNSATGREVDLAKATRAELQRLHQAAFRSGSSALVICGDVTPANVHPLVEKLFAGLPAGTMKGKAIAPPKAHAEAARLVFVDKPGATQSQVALADFGVAQNHVDRDAITVMNSVLGGLFSSRINLNLREKNAYTYGARSHFVMRRGAGPFSAGGAIFADNTAAAVGELFTEIRRMIDSGVTDDELEGAKRNVIAAMPAWFETTSDVAQAAANLFSYGLPADDYASRLKRIEAVTKEDVARVAKAYLNPARMKVVIVGDRAKIGASLEALHLGATSYRDAYGDPVVEGTEPKP